MTTLFPGYSVCDSRTFVNVTEAPVPEPRRSRSFSPTGIANRRSFKNTGLITTRTAHEDLVDKVVDKHVMAMYEEEQTGATLMFHEMPNKITLDPDFIGILNSLGARDVEYVYMPMSTWDLSEGSKSSNKGRNKGYAFVHFSTMEAAQHFACAIPKYTGSKKPMFTTLANHQGIPANLRALLSMPNKRRRLAHAGFYITLDVDRHNPFSAESAPVLHHVNLGMLRDSLNKKMTAFESTTCESRSE